MSALIGVSALSKLIDMSPKTLRDLARAKRIPAIWIGGRWKFDAAKIDRWIEKRSNGGLA